MPGDSIVYADDDDDNAMLCQGEGSAVLDWDEAELLQQVRHKHVWDLVHRIVFCPIAKVGTSQHCSHTQLCPRRWPPPPGL